MHQRWEDLLFLHWRISPQRIQNTLPPGLGVDTFGGEATKNSERDGGNGVAIDPTGNIYVTGTFAGTADLKPCALAQSAILRRPSGNSTGAPGSKSARSFEWSEKACTTSLRAGLSATTSSPSAR